MTRAAANRLLDLVRAGGDVPDADVLFALWMTGEFEMTPYSETRTQENPCGILEMDAHEAYQARAAEITGGSV
ncbi:MAG TPA: hypothetical protein PLL92_00460 [Alicycliphilus sp.]|nr:hypothetical protein [Alicycliphilus sp.]